MQSEFKMHWLKKIPAQQTSEHHDKCQFQQADLLMSWSFQIAYPCKEAELK